LHALSLTMAQGNPWMGRHRLHFALLRAALRSRSPSEPPHLFLLIPPLLSAFVL